METRDATAGLVIAYNGKPLTPEQRQEEKARVERFVTNPEELRKKHEQERASAERSLRIVRSLPDAFLFEYAGEQPGSAGIGRTGATLVKLRFRPNPRYDRRRAWRKSSPGWRAMCWWTRFATASPALTARSPRRSGLDGDALFAGFAIKVPLFPLHTWLPLAHTEAPAAGSILLAGVLLKIGTYGFLRFNLPMLPDATAAGMPCLLWLSVAGIIYGALVALAQSDLKRLIAYSSVSHLGFCMLGIFALNRVAVQGGALQMINHGLSTGGLFALVGMIYERYHTRRIADFGGIAAETPVLAFFMVFMTLASIGLPGLNGFVGEFLLLMGMFQRAWGTAATPVDRAVPGHFRAGRQRRRAGGLVYVVVGGAGLLRPLAGAEARRADRRPRPARGLGPGSLVPGHRLDRRAAEVLPRPHGPRPRQLTGPAMRAADEREDLTPRREGAKEQEEREEWEKGKWEKGR